MIRCNFVGFQVSSANGHGWASGHQADLLLMPSSFISFHVQVTVCSVLTLSQLIDLTLFRLSVLCYV